MIILQKRTSVNVIYNFTQDFVTTVKVVKMYTILKRTLMRAAPRTTQVVSRTCLQPRYLNEGPRRYYPGERRIIRYRKDMSEHDRKRLGLTEHEINHDNVQNTSTGNVEGLLTSSQNKNGKSPVAYDKVDSVKLNGTFIPLTDPKTKQPILGENGQLTPDPNKGGQWMSTYKQPRRLNTEANGYYQVNKDAQGYMDKHESRIKAIVEKNQQNYQQSSERQPVKIIGGRDDEPY